MTGPAPGGSAPGGSEPGGAVPGGAATDTPPEVVLLVDDSRTKRYVIRSWLRRAGYAVIEATTGAEALAVIESEPVDVVVLDVRLPDASGFDVCERIKARPASRALPVVHVSATAVSPADRTAGLTRGADAYLAEPIDPDELLATTRTMLRFHHASRRAERLAARVGRLAQATSRVAAARGVADLLRAAVDAVALVFEAPAVASLVTPDGRRLAAVIAGPGAEPAIGQLASRPEPRPGSEPTDRDGDPGHAGTSLRLESADPWRSLGPVASDRLWVAAVGPPGEEPPVRVGVGAPAGTGDDAHALIQLGQVVALAVRALRP